MEPLSLGFRDFESNAPIHTGSAFAGMVEMAFQRCSAWQERRGNLVINELLYALDHGDLGQLFLDAT